MTLHQKTLLFISSVLAGLVLLIYVASVVILLREFGALEQTLVKQDVEQILKAIEISQDKLVMLTRDWAPWDDSYQFVDDLNERFIQSNLSSNSLAELQANIMLFCDPAGQVKHGVGYDLVNNRAAPVPEGLKQYMTGTPSLLRPSETNPPLAGLALLPSGLMLVASAPILTSAGKGPARGTFMTGHYLQSDVILQMASLQSVSLAIKLLNSADVAEDMRVVSAGMKAEDPIFVRLLDSRRAMGYAVLHDIHGRPVALVCLEMPRTVYQQGLKHMLLLIVLVLGVGVPIGFLAVRFLNRTVLSRVFDLTRRVVDVAERGDSSLRMAETGADELSTLARSINRMLDMMSISQKALVLSQSELQESHQMLQGVIQSSPVAIITMDRDLRVTMWNKAAHSIFGWTADEVFHQQLPIVPESQRDGVNVLHALIQRENEFANMEAIRQCKDGRQINVSISMAPLYNGHHDVVGVIEVIADITERHRMEQEKSRLESALLQSQKMEALGRFASGINHDFNNILTVIRGNLSMLMYASSKDNPDYQLMEDMNQAVEQAAMLIQSLLVFSRKHEFTVTTISLFDTVNVFQRMLIHLLPSSVNVQVKIPEDAGKIKADVNQLQQVLMNLSVNARDAMPKGGTLTFGAMPVTVADGHASKLKPGEYMVLCVSDTGSGMDEEVRQHLFEPFFTTKAEGKGSGLGLSVVWGIVDRHNGFIEVESEKGKGTTFKVYWPRVAGV